MAQRPTPTRALTVDERRVVLGVLHEPRFADQAPAEVYARMLNEGRYLCFSGRRSGRTSNRPNFQCEEEDLNLHSFRNQNLNLARLPVSPSSRMFSAT
jgi:hypothetical protein